MKHQHVLTAILLCCLIQACSNISTSGITQPGSMFLPLLGNSTENLYDRRNTLFVVMANRSAASSVRLDWTTDTSSGSKEFSIIPHSGPTAYYFNISDCPGCTGRVQNLSLTPSGARHGRLKMKQMRFERECIIENRPGRIISCTADSSVVRITATAAETALEGAPTLRIYEYPFHLEQEPFCRLTLLHECPASLEMEIADMPNSRLGGRMSHLSTRFLATLRYADGHETALDEPFFIENWRDFSKNPYSFGLPEAEYDVTDFGASGNGFTDDTEAIQKAIDACAASGGGKVTVPGNGSPEGRRFVVTYLELRSGVELHIADNAVLWQSYNVGDYEYGPVTGHDFEIDGCPWTHCLYINRPLILGSGISRARITGPGQIRMADPCSFNPELGGYARNCSGRIHLCPIAICNSDYIEISDIDIIRCSNYHTFFYGDSHVFIGNCKLYEVRCVSGDGFSFGQGTRDVLVERCFLDSNDDGLVLTSSYRDPRGKVSPWRQDIDSADHSLRNIRMENCYINSSKEGGGKAVSFIPWGSTNPDQTKQVIDSIFISGCVLKGGHSVGTWCDNPFDGKPFTNTETDDWSPVRNIRILGNEYLSDCTFLSVKPENLVTDCELIQ